MPKPVNFSDLDRDFLRLCRRGYGEKRAADIASETFYRLLGEAMDKAACKERRHFQTCQPRADVERIFP